MFQEMGAFAAKQSQSSDNDKVHPPPAQECQNKHTNSAAAARLAATVVPHSALTTRAPWIRHRSIVDRTRAAAVQGTMVHAVTGEPNTSSFAGA